MHKKLRLFCSFARLLSIFDNGIKTVDWWWRKDHMLIVPITSTWVSFWCQDVFSIMTYTKISVVLDLSVVDFGFFVRGMKFEI